MKRILFLLLLLIGVSNLSAQQRRPVDSQHPLWLVHIDVWNKADPQKIIDLIPDDVKPYVCMNLSLSCGYDTERNVHKMPQNAIPTYKSWASICQKNGLWFTCQPASGGHTHILEEDLEIFEYFFKTYPNFLGWNYAEQFWGFGDPGDKYSSPLPDRIALFVKLVEMSHNYGGFLTVSFCGNIWSHPLNPIGMMKSNPDLLEVCQKYPEAILWLYKYTTSSCFYNNESVTFGPFVAGLAKNYGVRYDNCGWNGATADLVGENKCKYPVAAGIGTVMEQTGQNGGAVWDGPELIWTEDFKNLNNSNVSGYTRRNWGRFPGFDNAWIDMFRKIIDGTLYIPSREEVVNETKFIIVNNVTSGSDEDKYATWADLYDGLYKQTDPFNRNNGQWMDNYCYFKSTGRYRAIPMAPVKGDSLAQTIPNIVPKSARTTVWPSQAAKRNAFNNAYPEVSTGDLFVGRTKNQLVTYTPYTYLNTKKTATAEVPLQYNTCEKMQLTWNKLSSGLIREYSDSITFYLNNYRNDTTTQLKDIIVIQGATSQPSYTLQKRANALGSSSEVWDEETQTYTLTVSHLGPIDLTIRCAGAATDRRTDVSSNTPLELPKQPEPFYGEVIVEGEDMDYMSIQDCALDPYNWYKDVYGHAGNGFILMGTNKAGSLKTTLKGLKATDYRVGIRYMSPNSTAKVSVKVNAKTQTFELPKTERNEWKYVWQTFTVTDKSNTIVITNIAGVSFYLDNVHFMPADMEAEQFAITVREVEHGTVEAPATAALGDTIHLNVQTEAGYEFIGWDIIHGNIVINDDNTFVMPEDIVTLRPLFRDATLVYNLDFSQVGAGTLPPGWVAEQGSETHSYPNTYGSGSRTFAGFSGTYNKALYWREKSASYGTQDNFHLHLTPGDYKLTYAMAAWKGSPQFKAQIQSLSGVTIKESSYLTAAPNANGNGSADLSSATVRELEFTIKVENDYVIKFANNGTGFSEFLLPLCQLNLVPDPSSIDEIAFGDSFRQVSEMQIFDLEGRPRESLQHGMNIVRTMNGEIKKIYVK